jgi:hypothetical protein
MVRSAREGPDSSDRWREPFSVNRKAVDTRAAVDKRRLTRGHRPIDKTSFHKESPPRAQREEIGRGLLTGHPHLNPIDTDQAQTEIQKSPCVPLPVQAPEVAVESVLVKVREIGQILGQPFRLDFPGDRRIRAVDVRQFTSVECWYGVHVLVTFRLALACDRKAGASGAFASTGSCSDPRKVRAAWRRKIDDRYALDREQ